MKTREDGPESFQAGEHAEMRREQLTCGNSSSAPVPHTWSHAALAIPELYPFPINPK